jgi:rod shape-determining protein MreC
LSFRDGPLQDLRVPLAWAAAVATVVAGLIALALLLTDHRASVRGTGYGAARTEFDEVMEPVAAVVSAPVRWAVSARDYMADYFNAVEENRRLKKEVAELKHWRDDAQALRSLNTRYEALMKLRTDPVAPSVTARVVSDTRGPFSHARLADAGSDQGVKIGHPVISDNGVVGRVVGVSKKVSRVLLLTDIDSRTPVMIASTNARAILAGDGGDQPKLLYMRGHDALKVGDVVLTSGDGGLYPRGLPVGIVDKDMAGGWRVRLYSDRSAIDFVRIIEFEDFTQLPAPAELNNHVMPPITTSEKAQIDASLAARTAPPPAAAAVAVPGLPQPAAAKPTAKPAPVAAKPEPAKLSDVKLTEAKPAEHKPTEHKPAKVKKPAPATDPVGSLLQDTPR